MAPTLCVVTKRGEINRIFGGWAAAFDSGFIYSLLGFGALLVAHLLLQPRLLLYPTGYVCEERTLSLIPLAFTMLRRLAKILFILDISSYSWLKAIF
jgi:hypothetical protein